MAEFLKDMLQGVGPSVAQGRDTTLLREILEKTAQRIGNSLKDQPEVEAELRFIIGNAYIALGEGPEAEAMHRLALTIFSHLPSNENRQVAELLDALANDVSYQQRHVEAEALERNALAMWRKLLGNENLCAPIRSIFWREYLSGKPKGLQCNPSKTS